MNQTSNFGLSQWEKDDRIQMEDFNADNAKIEAALTTLSGTVAIGVLEGYDGSTDISVNLGRQPAMVMIGNRVGWSNVIGGSSGTYAPAHTVAMPGYPGYRSSMINIYADAVALEVTDTGFKLHAGFSSDYAPYYYLALFKA